MKKVIRLNSKLKKITLIIDKNRIDLVIGNKKFFAEYPFLTEATGYLNNVDEDLYRLMVWLLLYNLDEIERPEIRKLANKERSIVSYSGGVDSTALLYLTRGIPIHITRSYQPNYENRQIRACNNLLAHQITTDFEKIRELYIGRHGFSIGVGYASMYLPIMNLLGCNSISLGVVFDDLAFHYGEVFKFNNSFHNAGFYKIKESLISYGIELVNPLAGYSEILTTEMAAKSGIIHYSSCHTIGDEDSCRECYKCFRKEAIKGKPLEWNEKTKAKILPFLTKKPLKMAASTVYAIQKANYKDSIFDKYMDIDVSWCERVNQPLTLQFSNMNETEYNWQTEEDYKSIAKFVDTMNNPEMYKL